MEKKQADKIITEYFQKIYGFAVRKCYSYQEAEELCAEIVQKAYLSLLRAEEVYNVEGYIWRISEHTYARYVSVRKRQEGISIDGMEIPFYDEYALGEAEEEINRLRREIAFLTEKRRRIVYSFYYRDRSVSEIAREMGLPEGTVKWHLNKARNELKEGFTMERKIGRLGLAPVEALGFSHDGNPGTKGGPEFYLGDKMNLNIVYSVYHKPRTKEEIAEEMGMTLVYLEDRIDFLEGNGFLTRTKGNRYTTFVNFSPEKYSFELLEKKIKDQLQIAGILAREYAPLVMAAVRDRKDISIPGGNRQLVEAAAVFYGVSHKCSLWGSRDIAKYFIETTDGGSYIASVDLAAARSDPDYVPAIEIPDYSACGDMNRMSDKYPSVYGWSVDTRYSSREGTWANNLTSDYEALYEFICGTIHDDVASGDKMRRLKERKFLTEENRVNIMVAKGAGEDFFKGIPDLDSGLRDKFADLALEYAANAAREYPPQMQDLVIHQSMGAFIGNTVALMVMDILYQDGTFRQLTENERVTSNLIMFCDRLPGEG